MLEGERYVETAEMADGWKQEIEWLVVQRLFVAAPPIRLVLARLQKFTMTI